MTPLTVVLERRSSALYAARTHVIRGTLLSDAAVRELAEVFIELHAAHNEQGEVLDRAIAEVQKHRLEAARLRRLVLPPGEG